MKKNSNFLIPSLVALVASFSVNASNPNFDDVNAPNYSRSNYDTNEACYASQVVSFYQGNQSNGSPIGPDRSNPEMALYQPDASNAVGGFVSLGVDGYIVLGFDGVIYDQAGDDFMVYETSYAGDNCSGSNTESALIEFSQDGATWVSYGEICLDEAIDIAGLGLDYVSQIRITNTAGSPDGYDVDGVIAINGCQPIIDTRCFASESISYTPGLMSNGSPLNNPERMDPSKALGEPQVDNTNNFVSLGYGGEIVISFSGSVINNEPGDDLVVVETTFGNATFGSYPESADVYVSQNGVDFYWIGSAYTDESASFDIDNAMTPMPLTYITQVKLIDTTPEGSVSDDGYDLDGVIAINGCSEPDPVITARCNATEVLEYVEGKTRNGSDIDAIRTATPENVLGYPEGTDEYVFTTLGYGGSITLSFNGAVMNGEGDDMQFIETSFDRTNACVTYPEFADIYVSFDGYSWHMAGTVCKENNTIDISNAGAFEYIYYVKVVNNNDLSTTHDAYDLDGVILLGTCDPYAPSYNGNAFAPAYTATSDDDVIEVGIYPNPARAAATVAFTAKENGNASVELFDSYGRNVSLLYNKQVSAGNEYKIDFSVENLTNGVYFCKITNNNVTETKKIVISH